MKLFLETKINRITNLKYSQTEVFNPYDLGGASAKGFMKEIVDLDS